MKNRLLSKNIIQAIVNLQNGKHLQSDLVILEMVQTLKAAKLAQRLLSLHQEQWLLDLAIYIIRREQANLVCQII